LSLKYHYFNTKRDVVNIKTKKLMVQSEAH